MTDLDPKAFGQRLKEAREQAGLSRPALHERTGIPIKTIEKFENGTQDPTLARLEAIAREVGVSMEALRSNSPQPLSQSVSKTKAGALTQEENRILNEVRDGLETLSGLRDGNFAGQQRFALGVIRHLEETMALLEIEDLRRLAKEHSLKLIPVKGGHHEDEGGLFRYSAKGSTKENLAEFFQEEAEAQELASRLVDHALMGVDLYALDRKDLAELADGLKERHAGIERKFFGWGEPIEFVPIIRSAARIEAVCSLQVGEQKTP